MAQVFGFGFLLLIAVITGSCSLLFSPLFIGGGDHGFSMLFSPLGLLWLKILGKPAAVQA